jgi:hypothetical protein
MAVEPQRIWWRNYLLEKHIDPQSLLLSDGLHPNAEGNELIAAFFDKYFDNLVERWHGETEDTVYGVKANTRAGTATLNFDGSRLEMLSSRPIAAWPSITIDGKAPSEIDGCFQVTRSSPLESVPDWPSLRRITLLHDHVAEDWTATITSISKDQKLARFSVQSSIEGYQGTGDSSQTFVAKSGALSIEGEDWMFASAFEFKHLPLRIPSEVRWSVQYICGGKPEVIKMGGELAQYRYVLGAGLSNKKHKVSLSFRENDLADVEFRAYKPPL